MKDFQKHIISEKASVRDALTQLDQIAADAVVFVINDKEEFLGALTDGDIRRGLIKGFDLENKIIDFVQPNPKCFRKGIFSLKEMQDWRNNNYRIIPVIDQENKIIEIVNFRHKKSYLPLDAVIMAGGKGTRLLPLTETTPKPLLKIGEKPIIEYNIDRLSLYGINNITISVKYLAAQVKDCFQDGSDKNIQISYVEEENPLGTLGAVALIEEFTNDYILVMNSDLLTNIDYEGMFEDFINQEADMIVATTPYEVTIPYGVIETKGNIIKALKEKPTYTYYSNAGIYIFKREFIKMISPNEIFNATDLIDKLMEKGKKIVQYPILGYWLDIGKPNDYEKAQRDIKHIVF